VIWIADKIPQTICDKLLEDLGEVDGDFTGLTKDVETRYCVVDESKLALPAMMMGGVMIPANIASECCNHLFSIYMSARPLVLFILARESHTIS
jgi:hypothetical protein